MGWMVDRLRGLGYLMAWSVVLRKLKGACKFRVLGIWARTLRIRVGILGVTSWIRVLGERVSILVLEIGMLVVSESLGRWVSKVLGISDIVLGSGMMALSISTMILRVQAWIDTLVPVGVVGSCGMRLIVRLQSTVSQVQDKINERAITSGAPAGCDEGPASGCSSLSSEFGGIQTTDPNCPPIACFSIFLFRLLVEAYTRWRERHTSHIL